MIIISIKVLVVFEPLMTTIFNNIKHKFLIRCKQSKQIKMITISDFNSIIFFLCPLDIDDMLFKLNKFENIYHIYK